MAGLPPGDPQLVSMIVSHLKSQGLFDKFRRDCLADVDTKPAYLNLKQRVDNFVSNHLSNHTWSPHLNKNQLRNNIRQMVLQSGMLEQGVDRIVAQVVDPKVNHIFRPQVERVVREFLSPGSCSEEPVAPLPPPETNLDSSIPERASSSTPAAPSNALSILDTITSLNQEASVRASSATERGRKGPSYDDAEQLMEDSEQDMSIVEDSDSQGEEKPGEDTEETRHSAEIQAYEVKTEETPEQMELGKVLKEEVNMEEEEEDERALQLSEEDKEKPAGKVTWKPPEGKQEEDPLKSSCQAKQKARERIKEEYSLEDSDLEGLSDITVSSVHTSDLSSFSEKSEDEEQLSDSSEEGEILYDDKDKRKQTGGDTGDEDKDCKPRRKAYVYKPFLYSRYYSDSDDEVTVEERRRSVAKDKEERLLKRQQNRERMEEKRKHRAALAEEQDLRRQKGGDTPTQEGPRAKEARKERKVLEKKMALNRKRKLDSKKEGDVSSKKKGETGDMLKKPDVRSAPSKIPQQPKMIRHLWDSASSEEKLRRMSGNVSEECSDSKKLLDKARTHSFILELEQGSQEALKQRSVGKFDRMSRKEIHPKERKEKERSVSDERAKLKQKQERKSDHPVEELQPREGGIGRGSSEEKGEKKPKIRSEKKIVVSAEDVKKMKTSAVESVKHERDRSREKEKTKGEKAEAKGFPSPLASAKGEGKPLLRPDSTGSSEDRSDMEPAAEGSKKRVKHPKDITKRSKSHSEDRIGDRVKTKTDGEKEKIKVDPEKSNKSSTEPDKDTKKVKMSEKAKVTEKSKSKLKDETKTPLMSKTEKKVQSPEVRPACGASVSKPEATKEKKKDGNPKELPKVSEEPPSDLRGAKKKPDRKEKVPDKRDEMQEEKKMQKEDKLEKTPKPSTSSETEEPTKKKPDSEPPEASSSVSEDTPSDIASEQGESRFGEMPTVPAEADALLSLMDAAQLPPPDMELQDIDMKMKEAALTLLSMDPDSTVSSSLICQETPGSAPASLPLEEEEEELRPVEAQRAAEVSPPTSQPIAELIQEPADAAEEPENAVHPKLVSEAETFEMISLQAETTSSERQSPSSGETQNAANVPETQREQDEKEEGSFMEALGANAVGRAAAHTEQVPEICSQQDQTKSDAVAMMTSLTRAAEENQSEPDVMNREAVSHTAEQEEASVEDRGPPTIKFAVLDQTQHVDAGEGTEFKLVQQISAVCSLDTQEEEKEERSDGRGRCRRKPSNQKAAALKEPGAESDDVLQSTEESEPEKVAEVRTPRRGRSFRNAKEAEKEQPQEAERSEETLSRRGRRPGARANEAAAAPDDQRREESRPGASLTAAVKEMKEPEEESEPKENATHVSLPVSEETETCGPKVKRKQTEEPEEPVEDVQTEEMKDDGNQEQTDKHQGWPAAVIQLEEVKEGSSSETNAQDQEELQQEEQLQVEQEEEKKPEEQLVEKKQQQQEEEVQQQEKLQEEQETTPKRRRGRPCKAAAAAADDQDKNEKKPEIKENEQNEGEEEDEEGEDVERGAATRATTRLASRLEAERNKLSKPSTRASRQIGKDEVAAAASSTCGTRGQAGKGGRKREASPPAVRTRGGQKAEEPPSKRGKR